MPQFVDESKFYQSLGENAKQEGGCEELTRDTSQCTPWSGVSLTQLKNLAAGGVAGTVSRTCVSPLERTKILFQIQVENDVNRRRFTGVVPTLRYIWQHEGFRGYFKGNGTNVVRIFPYTAIQFAAYEEYKKLLGIPDDPREQTPVKRLTAGAMAGATSCTATYPLDLIRTRLTAQGEGKDKKYKNIRHCCQTILKEEGGFWSGSLYKGIFPTILGIAPYVGINFAVFETLKGSVLTNVLNKTGELEAGGLMELPVQWKLLCGAVSGATAQTISYPLDVIRRRMQMKGQQGQAFHYTSTSDAVTTILREEGVKGLYKGLVPNLIKVAPSMAVAFVTYEHVKGWLFGVRVR